MSQSIRYQFLFFGGSSVGGTPGGPLYVTAQGNPCSNLVSVKGLIHKTFEISAETTILAANPVILEGTLSENANDKTNWFPLAPAITASGIYTIAIAGGIFYEPELSHVRIRSSSSGQGLPFPLPPSIFAVMSGFWDSERADQWCERIKDRIYNGYKAV